MRKQPNIVEGAVVGVKPPPPPAPPKPGGREIHMTITNAGPVGIAPRNESEAILALFDRALASDGGSVDGLTKLVDLYDRMQRRKAELAFSLAFAEFQSSCPSVERTSEAKIAKRDGTEFRYTYADLEEIVDTVKPHLARHGFSFSFDSSTEKETLTCYCTLRHAEGHNVRAQFTLPTASPAGMSDQQKVAAAMTFAKRQVLISVLGLSLTEPDPDRVVDPTPVSDEQLATIEALIEETKSNRSRFCARFNIDRVMNLRAAQFNEAIVLLEKQRKVAR
jgi:hypothetical protein